MKTARCYNGEDAELQKIFDAAVETYRQNAFTIFTDWMALANWKNLFDEQHPPKAIIMRFPDVVNVSNGNSVVLNPYGPTTVVLPAEVVKKITMLEGYKQEFGAKEE